jgi:AraC-like DNA-binding protein
MSLGESTASGDWVRVALSAVASTSADQVLFGSADRCRIPASRSKPTPANRERIYGLQRHTEAEICIPIGGAALFILEGIVFDLHQPRIALIAPGVEHGEAAAGRKQHYSLMWMHLCSDGSIIALVIQYRPSTGWTCTQRQVMHHGRTQHLASLISNSVPSEEREFEQIRAELLTVLADLNRTIVQAKTASGKKKRNVPGMHLDILQRVQAFLDQNFARRISVREIAASSRFSPDYLNVMFTRWKGQSIGEYLIRRRMEEALIHCREGKLMVKEVARQLGYEDALYFSRAFHRYHGFWPTEVKPASGES